MSDTVSGDICSTHGTVATQHRILCACLLRHPRWWSELHHVITSRKLREQIHSYWCVVSLDRQLGVTPMRDKSAPRYGCAYRDYVRCICRPETPNTLLRSVPPHLHAGVVLDELRQHHLKPLVHLSSAQVHQRMQWAVLETPFHIPLIHLMLCVRPYPMHLGRPHIVILLNTSWFFM